MKIKNLIVFLFISSFCLNEAVAQEVKPEAAVILKNAVKNATSNKKNVLLTFYAQWIPWSAPLEKVLNDKECRSILQRYYELPSVVIKSKNLSRIKNYENPGADVLYTQYFSKTDSLSNKAYPLMVILNSKGTKLQQYVGYPDPYNGIKSFTSILNKTSSITSDEIHTITEKFNSMYKSVSPQSTEELLKEACEKAKAENKKVFLIFTASWCHWCHALEKAIEEPLCRKFFEDNFVIVPVIVKETEKRLLDENYGADKLLLKYQGTQREGIPFWIIFDKEGQWVADYNGYPLPRDEAGYKIFEEILKKTTQVTEKDLVNIKQAFTELGK